MNFDVLSAAEIRIEEVTEANNEACAALRGEIKLKREALAEADAAMQAAEEATDAAGYVQASGEQHVCAVALDMLERKLDKLENGSLVSQSERTATGQEVRAEQKAADREAQEKIAALLDEIGAVLTEVETYRRRADRCGDRWEYAETGTNRGFAALGWGYGLFDIKKVRDSLTEARKHLNTQKGSV